MFSFPWSNFHELNLDWILSVVKEAKDIFVRGEGDIQHAVETADQALETAEQAAAGVIADGAVTIPKVNDEVFNLMAYIVSGSVNAVAIPEGSLVILRKSTVYGVSDGIYVATAYIPASTVITASDLSQPLPLPDAGGLNYVLSKITDSDTAINAIERGLVIVVDGNDATSPVPIGGLAYLKNNENGLQEGIYANVSNASYPTTGGTADANTFTAVTDVLNSLKTFISFTNSNIGIVEDSNTATHTITAGQYVIWNKTLYVATEAIPLGTTLSNSNLTAVSNGGLNSLLSDLIIVEEKSYLTEPFSDVAVGELVTTLNKTISVAKTGYTPIAVTLGNNSSVQYNVSLFLYNESVFCRHYCARAIGGLQEQTVRFLVAYMKNKS